MNAPLIRVPARRGWFFALAISLCGVILLMVATTDLFVRGLGVWGLNIPVAWAFAITNFVWWIGIGHAGTFISAILLLVRQELRTAISRFAETMTVFAVCCAGLFPILHLGRPWFAYWLFPYPDTMGLWPQFRSPLVWDVFAVSTYLTLSALFWYVGLIPDLAFERDRAANVWAKRFYAVLAMGWRGSRGQWSSHRKFSLLMSGLCAPLVIAVHSIVGMDFAVGLVPGWHSTIFPPYFVAGAIFSGFAMVLTLGIPLRRALHAEHVITEKHLDLCAKFLLAMGCIVAYGYFMDVFAAFIGGDGKDTALLADRFFGEPAPVAWLMIFCNVVVPQALWSARVRANARWLFVLSLLVNVGMWCERFIIVATSLQHGLLPSSSRVFAPTLWDWAFVFGSLALFATLFLLFARFFPAIAWSEIRAQEAGGEK